MTFERSHKTIEAWWDVMEVHDIDEGARWELMLLAQSSDDGYTEANRLLTKIVRGNIGYTSGVSAWLVGCIGNYRKSRLDEILGPVKKRKYDHYDDDDWGYEKSKGKGKGKKGKKGYDRHDKGDWYDRHDKHDKHDKTEWKKKLPVAPSIECKAW